MNNADLLHEFRAPGLQEESALEAGCKTAWTHLPLLIHTLSKQHYTARVLARASVDS